MNDDCRHNETEHEPESGSIQREDKTDTAVVEEEEEEETKSEGNEKWCQLVGHDAGAGSVLREGRMNSRCCVSRMKGRDANRFDRVVCSHRPT